jgi:endonuclease/exonuclease/phosphatase family metal-dependent hydrolase
MRLQGFAAPLLLFVVGSACATGLNYSHPLYPRYAGRVPGNEGKGRGRSGDIQLAAATSETPATLKIVTFNIQFARQIDRAIQLLSSQESLRGADVIALQEMDAPSTSRIARALGMSYVYYPATVHPQTHRDFGDAILSRWPITEDRKILLPHYGMIERTQRIATAVTIQVGELPIRVYSMHLGTWVEVTNAGKRDQVETLLADAGRYQHVLIAGDANSFEIGTVFRSAGYRWATEHNPPTEKFFRWDHVFARGLDAVKGDAPTTGVVRDNLGASDHKPVWAIVSLNTPKVEVSQATPRH